MPVIAFAIFSFVLVFALYMAKTATVQPTDEDNARIRERLESLEPKSMAS